MDKQVFIRTETYALRLKPTEARKVTEEVNQWLNKRAAYMEFYIVPEYKRIGSILCWQTQNR